MEKYAWRARIVDSAAEEYKRRHSEIWPEMLEVLKEAGIVNYTIWLSGNELFGYTTNSPISMLEIVNTLSKGDIISHAFHGGKNNAAENGFTALKTAKAKGVLIDGAFSVGYHIDFSIFNSAVSKGFLPDIISTDITKEQEYIGKEKYGLATCMSIAEKCGMSKEEIFKTVTVNPARMLSGKNNGGYITVGDKADITVFKKVSSNLQITDLYNNSVILDSTYKCVLIIFGNEFLDYRKSVKLCL